MSSVVVLRTKDGLPQFSLEVLCNGVPCRAISLYDSSTKNIAVRFVSKITGVLLFRLQNLDSRCTRYFSVSKANLSPGEKWDELKESKCINKVNILQNGSSFDLQRDKTTGCAINLELLKDQQGRVLKDCDIERKKLARTKWRLQVAPTNDCLEPDKDLSKGAWTIHYVLTNDLPICLNMNGSIISSLELKQGVSKARDVKDALCGLLSSRDKLLYKGHALQDNDILSDCGITAFSTVRIYSPHLGFKLMVSHGYDKITYFQVKETFRVKHVKALFQDKEGIPVDRLVLMCEGKFLYDDFALSDYNITPDSVVEVYVRLIGGGRVFRSQNNSLNDEVNGRDHTQPVTCQTILCLGKNPVQVDPGNLAVGKIVPGKQLQEEKTETSILVPSMIFAKDLQFEIYVDLE